MLQAKLWLGLDTGIGDEMDSQTPAMAVWTLVPGMQKWERDGATHLPQWVENLMGPGVIGTAPVERGRRALTSEVLSTSWPAGDRGKLIGPLLSPLVNLSPSLGHVKTLFTQFQQPQPHPCNGSFRVVSCQCCGSDWWPVWGSGRNFSSHQAKLAEAWWDCCLPLRSL